MPRERTIDSHIFPSDKNNLIPKTDRLIDSQSVKEEVLDVLSKYV